MSALHSRRGVRGWAVPVALVAVALAPLGCASARSKNERNDAIRAEFRDRLVLACEAINRSDLEQATEHVDAARERAVGAEAELKVESLEHVIAGAEALRAGDVEATRDAWSRIEDPALQREVRASARLIGIDLPAAPQAVASREGAR